MSSIFGQPPENLDLLLKEGERKTAIAYSDASFLDGLKKAGGKLKKLGNIFSLISGNPVFKEGAEEVSKVTGVASEVGGVIVEFENELGINTSGEFSQSGTLHTSHEVDHPHKVNVGTIPDTHSPVPNSGSVYTYIPNRPSDIKQNFVAVS